MTNNLMSMVSDILLSMSAEDAKPPVEIPVPFRDGPATEWPAELAGQLVSRGAGTPTRQVIKDWGKKTALGKKNELYCGPVVTVDPTGRILGSGWALEGPVLDQAVRAENM